MARLLSINVGLPRDFEWKGRIVHTGIWKEPVRGRCRVGRLNLDGDGQGDLGGHGGEQRAVFVYQTESYRHWEEQLGRRDLTHGQFGENFTVEGLPDDQVCIGDRYRIGSALFEVTQPRVTCYRVGIRMNEPRMAALLTGSGKPGFYLRVLEEGEVGAGDEIIKAGEEQEGMTVAEINALLYTSDHPRAKLEQALRLHALSPGWRGSFEALLQTEATGRDVTGNSGLAPAAAEYAAKPGFRPLRISRIDHEAIDVISLVLEPADGRALHTPQPGQFIVLRLRPEPKGPPLYRSYSLSGTPTSERYRIGVKIEPHGAAGGYLSTRVQAGDTIDVSEPRGSFVLLPGDGPVVLLSAGIGVTPVLAILHALAAAASPREVWWLYGGRNGKSHPFAQEAERLVRSLAHCRNYTQYSRPEPEDKLGRDYQGVGHLGMPVFDQLGVPLTGDFYICGPSSFMQDLRTGLAAAGVAAARVHT